MSEYPNEIEMEKSLLGAMLQYGDEGILPVVGILSADDFYRPAHRLIFDAIMAVYETKIPDVLLVEAEMDRRGTLAKIDRIYLLQLIEYAYSATQVESYATAIREASIRRQIIDLGRELISEASDKMKSIEELVNKSEQISLTLTSNAGGKPWSEAKEITRQAFEDVMARSKLQGLNGVRTGLIDLDNMTKGLKPTDLIILAARPSMGKTALAMNIALAAARDVPVLIFSLEMSTSQLMDRFLSAVSGVNLMRIVAGTLTEAEKSAIVDGLPIIYDRYLAIDDTGGLSIAELKMRARQFKHQNPFKHQKGLGLIVIDYLQLIRSSRAYTGNRVQEVSEVSRELKALAKELDVPILALSQLSRNVEMRADKRPQLSDLRESGSIEQDADIVMFLYRDEYYNRDESEAQNIAEIIMAKNRNGATGSKRFRFDAATVCFADLTRREN